MMMLLLLTGCGLVVLGAAVFLESEQTESSQKTGLGDRPPAVSPNPSSSSVSAHPKKWRSGHTSVSDLAEADQRILCGVAGATPAAIETKLRSARIALRRADLQDQQQPVATAAIDRRSDGYASPIKDQGRCGSCVAAATTVATEICTRWKYQRPDMLVNLSMSHLFFEYGRATGASCKDGWQMEPAMDGLMRGIADESDFPYEDVDKDYQRPDTNLDPDWKLQAIRATSWDTADGRQAIQEAIDTHGAVAAVMVVYRDFLSYLDGIYYPTVEQVVGLHAVALVGFNNQRRCWIAQNSWSEHWGENGFFRIAYGACGIDDRAWFPTGTEFVQPNSKRNYFTRDMRHRPPDYLTGRRHQHKRSGSRVAEDCPECRSPIW